MTYHRFAALSLLALSVSGCGTLQKYNQGLDAQSQAYARQQKVLDEQNQIQLNELQAKQRQQQIEQSRAEGEMEKAKASGQAAAAVETARGKAQSALINAQAEAQANKLVAASLSDLLIRDHMISKLSDKSVIYLPSSTLPYMNVASPGALPSQMK